MLASHFAQLASEGFFEAQSTSLNSFEQAPLTKLEGDGVFVDDTAPLKVVLPPLPGKPPIADEKRGWVGYDNGDSTMWVNQENRSESYITKN